MIAEERERAALTVADLCSTSNDSTHTGEFGDQSTIGGYSYDNDNDNDQSIGTIDYRYRYRYNNDQSTVDYSYQYDQSTIDYTYGDEDDEDDSFLANNSLCRQHKSAIQMLDSLRKEVVQMVRSDDVVGSNNNLGTHNHTATQTQTQSKTPRRSPRNVTIDINSTTADVSSPLGSPVVDRDTVSVSSAIPAAPSLSDDRKTTRTTTSTTRSCYSNNEESTFCSMDDSIEHEMNVLKEVARDLEKELQEANIHTVYQAIERIGESEDPDTKNVLDSADKNVIREGIRNELLRQEQEQLQQEQTVLIFFRDNVVDCVESFEGGWMNVAVLATSIAFALIRNCISAWGE